MKVKLRTMKKYQKGRVDAITSTGELGRRIRALGIVPGVDIKVMGDAPLYDPVAIKVGEAVLALRNNEADHIFVEIAGE